MRFSSLMVVAIGLALASVSTAHAQVASTLTYWDANGASCVPGDPAIQSNLYTIGAGSVKFVPGNSGTITLYCTVPLDTGGNNPSLIKITYKDPDGTGANNHITARLIKLAKSNGGFTAITNAFVDSNSSSTTTDNQLTGSATFSETLDYQNYYYYVRVDIIRTDTTKDEVFYGVSLESPLP